MTNAPTLIRALGGKWHGHYGTAPCPACQPERRRDQNALSIARTATRRFCSRAIGSAAASATY